MGWKKFGSTPVDSSTQSRPRYEGSAVRRALSLLAGFAVAACSDGATSLSESSGCVSEPIVGGRPAPALVPLEPDGARAIVALLVHDDSNQTPDVCTGVLIASRAVLTAAHCFGTELDAPNNPNPESVMVVFGAAHERSAALALGEAIWFHPELDVAVVELPLDAPGPPGGVKPISPYLSNMTTPGWASMSSLPGTEFRSRVGRGHWPSWSSRSRGSKRVISWWTAAERLELAPVTPADRSWAPRPKAKSAFSACSTMVTRPARTRTSTREPIDGSLGSLSHDCSPFPATRVGAESGVGTTGSDCPQRPIEDDSVAWLLSARPVQSARMRDTSEAVLERYDELLRARSPLSRITATAALTSAVRRLAESAVRARPTAGASDAVVRTRVTMRLYLYGREVASRLFPGIVLDVR